MLRFVSKCLRAGTSEDQGRGSPGRRPFTNITKDAVPPGWRTIPILCHLQLDALHWRTVLCSRVLDEKIRVRQRSIL